MLTLGVDTSNYATSLAVVETGSQEVVCAQKCFLPVKKGEKGLRQSDAVFHHTVALPRMLQQLAQQCSLSHIEAVGVSARPRPAEGSYMPCFLAGVSFASAFAAPQNLPLIKTSHQQGHLASALLGAGNPALFGSDILFFHLSGGTTELVPARGNVVGPCLGKSLDLYAGQAIDRLGVGLGFAFPAGEQLSKLAEDCREEIDPRIALKGGDCHFSGLENQCRRFLETGTDKAYVAKYCLIYIAKTVCGMLAAARAQNHVPALCAGGVMASTTIRRYLLEHCRDIWFAPPAYSADNAIGVALLAAQVNKG